MAIFVDNLFLQNGEYRRVIVANTTGIVDMIANWSFAVGQTLTTGQHIIQVGAASSGIGNESNAIVSGNNSSVLQGQLTVIIVKK